MTPPEPPEAGFVLVDALVALVIFASAAALIYQIGNSLLSRADADLDHLSAVTVLHTEALLLQARGTPAAALVPFADKTHRYIFSTPPKEEVLQDGSHTGFYWAELAAQDLSSGAQIATIPVGFNG